MNQHIDIAALRAAATRPPTQIPPWLIEGKMAYSLEHQCNVKVLACLGDVANVEVKGQILLLPLEQLTEPDFTTTSIDLSSIKHPAFNSLAVDIIDEINGIKVLPGKEAECTTLPSTLHPHLNAALRKNGINQFYSHQQKAWYELSSGKSVAIVTPTASGKTLAFMPWVFQLALIQKATSLLIYPLRALAADQYAKMISLNEALPPESRLKIARCTGDVPLETRKGYFQGTRRPDIIVASPDVLHHMLYHTRNTKMQLWQGFLSSLKCCVLDEAHTYTSSFGIHFANLLRRLRLAITNAGGNSLSLSWVVATATIANPLELASLFSGLPENQITLINTSGARCHDRTFVVLKPQEAPNFTTAALVRNLMGYGLKGLVFVNSRHTAKSIFTILRMQMGDSFYGIDVFYGSLNTSARRQIISRLESGNLLVLISTNALEAGLDLPAIDFVVLRGSTSLNSFWQRAGRAGRNNPGLVIFIPDQNDHIDYYYSTQPEKLFCEPEMVKIQPNYPAILAKHLLCAGAESGIYSGRVSEFFGKNSDRVAAELLKQNQLFWSRTGILWTKGYPHKEVSLRGILDDSIVLVDADTQEILEEMTLNFAHRECHQNAIYLTSESGKTVTWRCSELDVENHKAILKRMDKDDYRTLPDVELVVHPYTLLEQPKTINTCIPFGNIRLSLWWGTIREEVLGYREEKLIYAPACTNRFCSNYCVPMPQKYRTCPACSQKLMVKLNSQKVDEVIFDEALVTSFEAPILRIEVNLVLSEAIAQKALEIKSALLKKYGGEKEEIPALQKSVFECQPVAIALHSLSHMLTKSIPLVFLASANDINSLTTTKPGAKGSNSKDNSSEPDSSKDNANTGSNGDGKSRNGHQTVAYLFDAVDSGCGTSEALFTDFSLCASIALELANICDCGDIGCPRCLTIHSCPELNAGLSKTLGMWLLGLLAE